MDRHCTFWIDRGEGAFKIDGQWLYKQAEELPAYGEEAIRRQGRLLASTLRDQVRLTGLENELNSLSGQLANTYEELSLIYQVSSGMKINRRASDFFKQACLDVLEVLGVRGMGVALKPDTQPLEPVLYGSLSLPPGKVHRLICYDTNTLACNPCKPNYNIFCKVLMHFQERISIDHFIDYFTNVVRLI